MFISIGNATHERMHRFTRHPGFPHWTIGLLWRGRGRIRQHDAARATVAGQILITRPGAVYGLELAAGTEETWIFLDPPPHWRHLLAWPEIMTGIAAIEPGDHHADILLALREMVVRADGDGRGTNLSINALERALLLAALDHPPDLDQHDAGVLVAVRALDAAPRERTTVATLARQARMSVSHFARSFRAAVGMPPLRYLELRRIERAQHLLLTTKLSVKEVAAECGFADAMHLSKRFRSRCGCPPVVYRRNRRS